MKPGFFHPVFPPGFIQVDAGVGRDIALRHPATNRESVQ